mmetsp:Transcript_33012/g.77443  ORF Transcript_33012/g.77443 Transcript_33012/m.77443 type:complete len:212 (-) Transcript_33012:52-687(-)
MLPVPASNLAGAGWNTVRSKVTSAIMLPPPCQGGMASSTSLRPMTAPMPVGPKILWPLKMKKSQPMACTSTARWDTDCAPSTSVVTPWRCAMATSSCTGTTVPSALLTWVTASSLVLGPISLVASLRMICPVSSTGITRRCAPLRAASCCQGTMLAWCSRWETTISSPAPTCCSPQVLATRLIASVAPRTKMTSSAERALTNCATVLRAAS